MSNTRAHIAAGIFATEPGQRFLTILKLFVDRGFRALYDKCKENITGDYYQNGLRRVHVWSDVIVEDCNYVRSKCRDPTKRSTLFCTIYPGSFPWTIFRPTCSPPSVPVFVRHFLESVAQNDILIDGSYFILNATLRTVHACMDAARQALYTLVTVDTGAWNCVEAGSTASRRPAQLRGEVAPTDVSAAPPPPPANDTSSVSLALVERECTRYSWHLRESVRHLWCTRHHTSP